MVCRAPHLSGAHGDRWNAPSTVKTLLHTDMGGLLVALVSKFAEWTEEAFFFDGACLGALAPCATRS